MKGWESLGFKSYRDYLQTERWLEISQKIREEVGNKCEFEGCEEKSNLHVHHLNYNNVGNESFRDLVLLCAKHHKESHETNNEILKDKIKRVLNWD